MKIFVSWSGDRSRTIAEALVGHLRSIFGNVEVFLSTRDIGKGDMWPQSLTVALSEADFGILCLTPENVDSTWLMFEAGAIFRALGKTQVVPLYTCGLKPTDVRPPLGLFQGAMSSRDEILKIIQGVHMQIEDRRTLEELGNVHHRLWPQLETVLLEASRDERQSQPLRTDREILEEILANTRLQSRQEDEGTDGPTYVIHVTVPSANGDPNAEPLKMVEEIRVVARNYKGPDLMIISWRDRPFIERGTRYCNDLLRKLAAVVGDERRIRVTAD